MQRVRSEKWWCWRRSVGAGFYLNTWGSHTAKRGQTCLQVQRHVGAHRQEDDADAEAVGVAEELGRSRGDSDRYASDEEEEEVWSGQRRR